MNARSASPMWALSVLLIVGHAAAQEPEPTPSGEVSPATGGGVILDASPTPTPAWPSEDIFDIFPTHSTIDEFREDKSELARVFRSGALAEAWVRSGSNLFKWSTFPDYLGLLEEIQEFYGHLPPDEVEEGYEIRLGIISEQTPDCFACMDAGLMAMATGRYLDAQQCFQLAADAGFYQGNPAPRVMSARAILNQGQLSVALSEYAAALAMADEVSGDPTLSFRLRYTEASDLFAKGYLDESLARIEAMYESEYLPERLYAARRLAYYHWCKQNWDAVHTLAEEVENLVQVVEPRSDVLWELRRVHLGQKLLDRLQGASAGDPVQQLMMDEESLEWEWQAGNFQAIVDRLRPWVERYPIAEYAEWGPDLQRRASLAHWTYHISLANVGDLKGAEEGLRGLVENVPFGHSGRRVVDSWCWLGHVLGLQQRYAEAVAAMETGLGLDVSGIDPEEAGVPTDFNQPRVRGGEASDEIRAEYVKAYRTLLKYYALGENYERLKPSELKREAHQHVH